MKAREITNENMDTCPTKSDGELLRHYVGDGCEAAFAQIGRRYAGMVYSACLRELRDPMLAEDAAQAVFLLLAQKAPTLQKQTSLAGWLFTSARLISQNLRRQEARRKQYEEKAARFMMETEDERRRETTNELWEATEPHLNEALTRLKPDDREAVLLRFFEGCSLAEVGRRIGVPENTARMRIARALEKMRVSLRKVGIVLTIASLSALLTERAAQAAPATLQAIISQIAAQGYIASAAGATASIAASASAATTISPSAVLLTKGILKTRAMTMTQKTGVAAGAAALALLFGGAAVVSLTGATLRLDPTAANPGFHWFASAPDPAVEKTTAPFVGKWQGTVENLNPANGQWMRQNMEITFARSGRGLSLDFGGKAPGERYDFDAAKNQCTLTGREGTTTYQMTGFREFAEHGGGKIVMVPIATSKPVLEPMRGTVTLEGDTMTLINERTVGDQYRVMSRQTYRRAKG